MQRPAIGHVDHTVGWVLGFTDEEAEQEKDDCRQRNDKPIFV